MAQRSIKAFLLAVSAVLLAAGPAFAVKVGHISVKKGGKVVLVETDGATEPVLRKLDKKILVLVPHGERASKPIKVDDGPISQIRFGMEGGELHMVLDLTSDQPAKLSHVGAKGFEIDLGGAPAAEAADTGAAAAAAASGSDTGGGASTGGLEAVNPAQAGYTYRVVDLSLGGDEKHSQLIVSADGPASYKSSVRESGRLLSLTFRNSSLAWSGDAQRLKDGSIASVDVKQVLFGGESQVKVDIHLTDRLDYAFKRDQNQLVVSLDRPAKAEAPAATGDMETPVSLDVQGADLVGILKTLCEQAGFDYQFTKDLLAKTPPDSLVTVKVENRPFREVLDTLLQQVQSSALRQGNTIYMGNETEILARRARLPVITRSYHPKYLTIKQIAEYIALEYLFNDSQRDRLKGIQKDPRDPSGSILLLGSEDEVAVWLNIIKKYDVPEVGEEGAGEGGDNGGPKTQVFHLQYLDANNSGLINGAIAQLYPEGETPAQPLIDGTTRTMVVTTQVKYLRKIQKLLDRIDIKPMQVNIEGKIVEVDQGVSQQMGINWNAATVASSLMDPNTLKPVPNQLGSFNTGLTGGFTSQLQTAILVGQNTLNSTIQAMVDLNKADIVSAPNITTNDNQAATISTTDVQVYANSTTTISNGVVTLSQTFTNSNIPLTLVVTPKISKADRRIMMNINFQLTTTNGAAPGPNAPAPTSQQSAITNVSVNSGDTAVIGGLVRQNNTSEVRKVPVLGDIPLLGLLFKFTTVNKTKKEVIIFITPTIVED